MIHQMINHSHSITGSRSVYKILSIGTVVLLLATAGLVRSEPSTNSVPDAAVKAQNTCVNNLRQIDAAKQQWALEYRKKANDVPRPEDIAPYIIHEALPKCPSGGTYTIGRVGEDPTCSIPGHVLPPP